jgi:hypothetical protein
MRPPRGGDEPLTVVVVAVRHMIALCVDHEQIVLVCAGAALEGGWARVRARRPPLLVLLLLAIVVVAALIIDAAPAAALRSRSELSRAGGWAGKRLWRLSCGSTHLLDQVADVQALAVVVVVAGVEHRRGAAEQEVLELGGLQGGACVRPSALGGARFPWRAPGARARSPALCFSSSSSLYRIACFFCFFFGGAIAPQPLRI